MNIDKVGSENGLVDGTLADALDYANRRLKRLPRKPREDKPQLVKFKIKTKDPETGEEVVEEREEIRNQGGTTTTSMVVSFAPTSLLRKEYGRVGHDGKWVPYQEGEDFDKKKAWKRWVPIDREAVIEYFDDVLEYLKEHVLPDGEASILALSYQFDEGRPHLQITADTFAEYESTDKEGDKVVKFGVRTAQAFFGADEQGRGGSRTKGAQILREQQDGLKRFLIDRGWDIEDKPDPRNKGNLPPEQYAEMKQWEEDLQREEFAQRIKASDLKMRENRLRMGEEVLQTEQKKIDSTKAQLVKDQEELDATTSMFQAETDELKEEARQLMRQAKTMEKNTKARAQGEARDIIEEANKQAMEIVQQARNEVDSLTSSRREQAGRYRDEAGELLQKARNVTVEALDVLIEIKNEANKERLKKESYDPVVAKVEAMMEEQETENPDEEYPFSF